MDNGRHATKCRVYVSILQIRQNPIGMWKVKLDEGVWLADGVGGSATTTNEAEAWLLPDMPAVQAQLKKVRRYMPYPNAMVVAEFPDYCP